MVGNSCPLPFFSGQTGMRCCSRPGYEALDSAQTRCRNRQSHARNKLFGRIHPSVKLEAKHPTKSVEQLPGAIVVGMPLEPGIIDVVHRRMSIKKARYFQSRVILMAYAHPQSFHPTV